MPMLTVLLAAAPSDDLAAQVAADLLDLTTRHLGKRADLTAIAVQFVEPAHWFIGGEARAGAAQHAAFVETRVSDETNTPADKSRYIAAVFAALGQRLGPLHPVSYVQVQDLRPTTWGWGGRTQAARALSPPAEATPA
jgi:4-oxalocrotonate tautomerase